VRVPRALHEFVAVPLLVVAALLLLAVASIYGDQAHGPALTALRGAIGHLIGKQAASAALGAIATGLVTVTSITFSVLLLAVQQTASSLSPVVFDQFVRRRANQVFLGLFVGLALYAYVVLAAVQKNTPPIIGAFLATVLTVAALCCLLFLVYSTIDQMRPRNVVRQLHDRAAGAHDREAPLVGRTRREPLSRLPVRAEYRSETFGYVESIDLDLLAQVLDGDRPGRGRDSEASDPSGLPEVELHVTVGTEVAFGDVVALVRADSDASGRQIRERVERAIALSPAPDLDFDATIGIRDLSNIGWTSGSTSKQNPAIAAQALHALRDLAVRWCQEDDRTGPNTLPVVYPDDDLDTVLNALYSAIVAAHESHQHEEAARVLDTYTAVLAHAPDPVADRIRTDLEAMQPLLDQMPASPALAAARRRASGGRSGPRPQHQRTGPLPRAPTAVRSGPAGPLT
jgi:hypothetical protein